MSLITEGRANELAHVIQNYRRSIGLAIDQKIELSVSTDEPYISMAIREFEGP